MSQTTCVPIGFKKCVASILLSSNTVRSIESNRMCTDIKLYEAIFEIYTLHLTEMSEQDIY